MDSADITDWNLERNCWGYPLPPLRKQDMICPSCGAEAVYCQGMIHCLDLCGVMRQHASAIDDSAILSSLRGMAK